jgi:hypothetical protein
VVWTKGWVVYCKPTTQGREQVLNDLGRYVHRLALTNHRLLSIADGQVCFRYQDSEDQRWKTMTLPALSSSVAFCSMCCPRFHNVRDDGLWRPVHRPLLHQLQLCLAGYAANPPPPSPEPTRHATDSWCPPFRAGHLCPSCGQGLLVVIRLLPRYQRRPP